MLVRVRGPGPDDFDLVVLDVGMVTTLTTAQQARFLALFGAVVAVCICLCVCFVHLRPVWFAVQDWACSIGCALRKLHERYSGLSARCCSGG
jgi:protein-S-isoprenylcysteine O-methyltransferase Ste14